LVQYVAASFALIMCLGRFGDSWSINEQQPQQPKQNVEQREGDN